MATLGNGVVNWLNEKSAGCIERDANGVPVMSAKTVRCLCLKHQGYECEEINDKLYLHFQGFRSIGGLEKYTGVKCLYLESNGLGAINGINHLSDLRCLYLQQNVIKEIGFSAFGGLDKLVTLDISQNLLRSLDGISNLVSLQTLNVSKNYLATKASILDVGKCSNLASLDLRNNQLEDEDGGILQVFDQMGRLSALYLTGNPVVKHTKHYRKTLVNRFERLTYLDDKPVDEHERCFAQAWASGGREAEMKAREEWKSQQKEKTQSQVESWRSFKERTRQARAAELEKAKSEGRQVPEPKSFVSYRTVNAKDEDLRQQKIREIAVAEAEAERMSVLGNGIQMLGLDFAKETAERNGVSFEPIAAQPPVPPSEPTIGQGFEPGSTVETVNEQDVQPESRSEIVIEPDVQAVGVIEKEQEADKEEELRQWRVQESLRLYEAQKQLRKQPVVEASTQEPSFTVEKPLVQMEDIVGKLVEKPKVVEKKGEVVKEKKPLLEVNEDMLKTMVREYKFDFAQVATELKKKTGLDLAEEDCRVQFSNMNRKEKQEVHKSSVEADEVFGNPMPKVGVIAPTTLPSAFDSDEEQDPVGSDSDPTEEDTQPFRMRQSRQDILESLHGSSDHPLSRELCTFETLD
mmetsp:Transcript_12541/g.22745  ORF Transcript_12541/g.22745 Transcript_12541/m.22745 type:complete len:633 (-) Transcript_12541:3075-4973(-)